MVDAFESLRWDGCQDASVLVRRLVTMGTWEQVKAVRSLPVPWDDILQNPQFWRPLTRRQGGLLAHLAGTCPQDAIALLGWCRGDPPSKRVNN